MSKDFDEAKAAYTTAKTAHAGLVKDLQNKIVKQPKMSGLRKIDKDGIARFASSPDLPNLPKALENLDRLEWATAWLHKDNKYRSSVRQVYADIAASEEILTQARRKYARSIKAKIEEEPHLAAAREAIMAIFWARVMAGIQAEWHQLIDEYFKKLSDEELRQAKPGFLNKYGLD